MGLGLRLMRPVPTSVVVGVDNNPDPVAAVRGVEGASRNNNRPHFVACGFQVRKHAVEAHCDVASNIFTKEPAGPALLNKAQHFRPEPAVICRACAVPGQANWLARVAGGNNVGAGRVVDIVDGAVLMGTGEVAAADGVAKRVRLAGPDGADAGFAGSQCKAADAIAKGTVGEGVGHVLSGPGGGNGGETAR